MWARWLEGALLLYASGLGTNGEMDAAADEGDEDSFVAWAAAQTRGGSGPLDDIAEGSDDEDTDAPHASAAPSAAASQDGLRAAERERRAAGLSAAFGAALGLSEAELRESGALGEEDDGVRPPPPAHPALQAYRDSSRSWICHLCAAGPWCCV